MILDKIQIRYYPPGLNLIYRNQATAARTEQKQLDLYGLDPSNPHQESLIQQLVEQESDLLAGNTQQLEEAVASKYSTIQKLLTSIEMLSSRDIN